MEKMIEPKTNKNATIQAVFTLSFPEAMARFFFTGWSLSFGASIMSLIKYAAEEMAQNVANAFKDIIKTSGLKSTPAKSGAANKLKFFNHCLGRAVLAI